MKRSRLFLASSAALLAVAGIAAAKSTKSPSHAWFLTVNQKIVCRELGATVPCLQNDSQFQTCLTTVVKSGTQFKTVVFTSSSCVKKLHYIQN